MLSKAKVRCWEYTLQKVLGAVEAFTIHLRMGEKNTITSAIQSLADAGTKC